MSVKLHKDPEPREVFLSLYGEPEAGSLSECARMAGISRVDVEHWIEEDSIFAATFKSIQRKRTNRVRTLFVDNLTRIAATLLNESLEGKNKIQAAKLIFQVVGLEAARKTIRSVGITDEDEATTEELDEILADGK